MHLAEKLLLLVEIWRHQVAHQGEERGNGEGLVGLADDLEVHRVPVVPKREEGRRRIYGYHEEDSNDAVIR